MTEDSMTGGRLLPDLFLYKDGEKVTNVEQWEKKRRPEILELFRRHVYGRAPIQRPEKLMFETEEVKENIMEGNATLKKINIVFEGPYGEGKIGLILFVPTHVKKPVPCFLLICNRSKENMDKTREVKSDFWPAEYIISRGYAAAVFHVSDVDPDEHDGFKNGVHGIFDSRETPRSSDAWGTISAWAWGASRVMDYLETDSDIHAGKVAVIGHSRGGKTALWCGAQDERFSMVVSNNSGCTGAALSRGKKGETISDINRLFPHWFCENYKIYAHRENDLPVDQHMLLALIAPRLLYVASATQDDWADPQSEFLSCVHAEPIYHFYGLKGLETTQMPEPESPVHKGKIGYHLRTGEHDLTWYDWKCYLDFADKNL